VQIAVLCTVLLVVTHIPMGYFDGYVPRALQWSQFRSVIQGIADIRASGS